MKNDLPPLAAEPASSNPSSAPVAAVEGPAEPHAPAGGTGLAWLLVLVLLIGAAGGGWWWWQSRQPATTVAGPAGARPGAMPGSGPAGGQAARPGPGGPPSGFMGGPPAVPVVAATAVATDIPIVLEALGTVTANQTATVQARVPGLLEKIHFREGDQVEAGQLLAEIDARQLRVQLAQAEAQLARDRAQLENARVDLRRYETLFKQDSIARQQVDTQAALVRQLEAVVRVDQSAVETARLQLSYARVVAPISGRAGLRQVDPGNMVSGNEANGLVIITEVQPISVLFTVPQDELPAIRRRMNEAGTLPVLALDRSQQNQLASGELISIDNQIDPATGTIRLRARFANEDGALFPNQFVNIRLERDTLRGAITIPSAAIQRGAQGLFVYVVTAERTVTTRTVELGPVSGQNIAIRRGLQAGEQVVIDGIDRLRDGATVELIVRPDFSAPTPAAAPRERRPRGPNGTGQRGPRPAGAPPPAPDAAPATPSPGPASGGGPAR